MNKSTRKKILMQLCLLGLLVILTTSVKAQLLGTLNHAESWSIEFVGLGSSNVADVTVTFIDSRGKQDVDVFTIPISGIDRTLIYNNANIGSNIRRIIINIDFPIYANAGTEMSIWQGDERPGQPPWIFPVVNDATPTRYVFNVATAP